MPKYYSPDGNIEVWEQKPEGYYTVEEWQELHPAPAPPAPTTEEKLAELDAQYNADKNNLMSAYLNALVYGNTKLADEIKADISDLDKAYDTDYEEISGGADDE